MTKLKKRKKNITGSSKFSCLLLLCSIESYVNYIIYIGFFLLKLSELLLYDWYYDELQPFFAKNTLKLQYMGTDSLIFSFKPIKCLIEDLKLLKEDLDLRELVPFHEIYS